MKKIIILMCFFYFISFAPLFGYIVSGMVYYSTTPLDGVSVELVQGTPTSPPLQSTTTSSGFYSFSSVDPGSYYIKVYGPNDEYIGWRAHSIEVVSNDITKDMYLPKKMTLLSPENNATVSSLYPTLSWEPNSEAVKYEIQINVTKGWQLVEHEKNWTSTSYIVVTELTPCVNYTWQVGAYDAHNHYVGTTQTAFLFNVLGTIIYVDALNTSGIEYGSQEYPFNTIQEGIDASLYEDIILVADGTYIGVGNRDLDFKGKAITVQSENGPEFCIIDCENSGRGFWFHSGEIEQSVVSGFTITNGSALNGGGIHCENASPTITNNIIIGNSASNFGGGISSWNSIIRINDSIIEDNFCSDWGSGAGVAILDGSSLIMRNSFVVGNSAPFNDGGGIYIDTSSCIIVNSVIANNFSEETGGGFCIENGSDYKIINSTIVGNQTPNAIGAAISVINDAHITLTNCIISNNVGNTGFDEKYGWGNSTITLNYCNTFNNSPDGSVSIMRNYCLGDPPTEGINPIFVDLDEDYHLQECSSCIGAGIMILDVPDTDIEGNPRPNPLNSNPDLGAYESSLLEEVNISLSITVGIGGNTNPSPGGYCYSDVTEVTITATAEPEYRFSGWTGDASGTINPITITMDSDKSITANFIRQYTLIIVAGTGGKTEPSSGSYIYDVETQVSVRAIPNSGYRFSGWSGDATGTTSPITITMDADKSITASFVKEEVPAEKKGGCFIATATYGSSFHPYVKILREFRDIYLMPTALGRKLVDLYYKYSPFAIDLIIKHKILKIAVRSSLLPFVGFSYSMLHFGPIITVVVGGFIFVIPIFFVLFYRKKMSEWKPETLKPWLPEIERNS